MSKVEEIIKDTSLTYEQQVINLARYAESTIEPIVRTDKYKYYESQEVLSDMFEGNAPYRPRYIIPNYRVLMEKGCEFLGLDKPTNIWEATNSLLILYKHVPSITSFPVFLGNLDELLEPFVDDIEQARIAIRLFLIHIDKTLTDSFVHANIGPYETTVGTIILEEMSELELAIPNLTVKYDQEKTSKEFAMLCAKTSLKTAKPSFANDKIYRNDFTQGYGIASCYNGLTIGGGGFTLMRLNLNKLAKLESDLDNFDAVLVDACEELISYINRRIDYIVNQASFFKTSFLVKEGFIKKDLFSGMFGVVGLAECVNTLLKAEIQSERFGYSEVANELGLKIVTMIEEVVNNHPSENTTAFDGKSLLHAQVGLDTDYDTSPGARIPVGEEPDIYDHIIMSAPFHKYFTSGIGDIFVFDQTYMDKPEAIVKIIDGAMEHNLRYISTYSENCDVVRVTGYLVKRSELEKLDRGEAVLNDATVLGQGARDSGKALERKRRV